MDSMGNCCRQLLIVGRYKITVAGMGILSKRIYFRKKMNNIYNQSVVYIKCNQSKTALHRITLN